MRLTDVFNDTDPRFHARDAVKARAEQLGFDTSRVFYHGSRDGIDDINSLFWVAETADFANMYADHGIQNFDRNPYLKPHLVPVYLRRDMRTFNADLFGESAVTVDDVITEMFKQAGNTDFDELRFTMYTLKKCARREESGPHYSVYNFWYESRDYFGRDGAVLLQNVWQMLAFDCIKFTESGKLTFGVFNPQRNMRGIFAKFKPDGADVMEDAPVTDKTPLDTDPASSRYDTLYHWTNQPDFKEFQPFSHFGTSQAAQDRYRAPLGHLSIADMRKREESPPPEGATLPVRINRDKVLMFKADTGTHDAFSIAQSMIETDEFSDRLMWKLWDVFRSHMQTDDEFLKNIASIMDIEYYLEEFGEERGADIIIEAVYNELDIEMRNTDDDPYGEEEGDDGYPSASSVRYMRRMTWEASDDYTKSSMIKVISDALHSKGFTAIAYPNHNEGKFGELSFMVPDPRNVKGIFAKSPPGQGGTDFMEAVRKILK